MMRKAMGALAGLALLAGCGEGGETYEMSAKDVRAKLMATQPPLMVFGSMVRKASVVKNGDGTIRWVLFDRSGRSLMRIVATVEEKGPTTSAVAVSIEPPDSSKHDQVAKGMADNPSIVNLYRKAMIEQIDAKLENREFDMAAITPEMMAATVATVPQIQKSALEAARQSEQMDRENMDRAYREEGRGY